MLIKKTDQYKLDNKLWFYRNGLTLTYCGYQQTTLDGGR